MVTNCSLKIKDMAFNGMNKMEGQILVLPLQEIFHLKMEKLTYGHWSRQGRTERRRKPET
jgi:hypothetical protein